MKNKKVHAKCAKVFLRRERQVKVIVMEIENKQHLSELSAIPLPGFA